VLSVSQTAAMKFFNDEDEVTYRFWRFEIEDKKNYLGPEGLEFSYVYIGDHETITMTNYATGFTKELSDPSNVLESENGALFFEKRPRFLTISGGEIQFLTGEERGKVEQLFYDLGVRESFIVSIDPGVEVTLELEELTKLCVLTRSPQLKHILRDYYNLSLELREAF
jgi:hypothetical protein